MAEMLTDSQCLAILTAVEPDISNLLSSSPDEETACANIAAHIRRSCAARILPAINWEIWWSIIRIIKALPLHDRRLETFVAVMDSLRQVDGPIDSREKAPLWKELPWLAETLLEEFSRDSPFDDHKFPDGEASKDAPQADFTGYMNFQSFAAQLLAIGYSPLGNFPIWFMRDALETPAFQNWPQAMKCNLWSAREWILRCGDKIYKRLTSGFELDDNGRRSLRVGSLCDSSTIAPLSVERWQFWKKRFAELVDEQDDPTISSWVPEISQKMDAIEAAAKGDDSQEGVQAAADE